MPNFLIIGAPKSGTTSLAQYLGQHPEIYISPQKEPYFFAFENEQVDFLGPGIQGKDHIINNAVVVDLEEYRRLFQGVSDEVAIGEASTLYLAFPKAAERIKHHIPDVKLIAILRNPADRAYSAFMHALRDNYESITDFSSALAAEEERIKLNWGPLWRYQDQGFYYRQLKQFFDLFDSHQIKIYLYEDLVNNRSGLLRDVFDFIGVDENFIPDTSAKYNVTGIPKNKLLHELLSKPNLLRTSVKTIIPQGFRKKLAINLKNANLAKPELPQEIRQQLIEIYREDILELQKLIQRDLTTWLQ
jgi:hypothetical protein